MSSAFCRLRNFRNARGNSPNAARLHVEANSFSSATDVASMSYACTEIWHGKCFEAITKKIHTEVHPC
jgi:hypothetical protein